jgi:hypothetical protein
LLAVLARDLPCPHCGLPFARGTRRRVSLFRRSCRHCGVLVGTPKDAVAR